MFKDGIVYVKLRWNILKVFLACVREIWKMGSKQLLRSTIYVFKVCCDGISDFVLMMYEVFFTGAE